MSPHQLTLEETGYSHARLYRPVASSSSHYLRGYRQGTRDRLTFQGLWEAYQLSKLPALLELSRN